MEGSEDWKEVRGTHEPGVFPLAILETEVSVAKIVVFALGKYLIPTKSPHLHRSSLSYTG